MVYLVKANSLILFIFFYMVVLEDLNFQLGYAISELGFGLHILPTFSIMFLGRSFQSLMACGKNEF